MKLTELVENLTQVEKIEEFIKSKNIETPIDELLIYLKGELNINSEVVLFSVEETEDRLLYKVNGISYVQLFPVEMAVDLIQMFQPMYNFDIVGTCERLIEYRINDA